jgi:hypothetical protein
MWVSGAWLGTRLRLRITLFFFSPAFGWLLFLLSIIRISSFERLVCCWSLFRGSLWLDIESHDWKFVTSSPFDVAFRGLNPTLLGILLMILSCLMLVFPFAKL